MYACTELESVAREFIFQNFLLVSHTEEFFELSEDQLIGLLKSDKLHVTSENQVTFYPYIQTQQYHFLNHRKFKIGNFNLLD